VIDGITNAVNNVSTDGGSPVALAVNPATNKVYVSNYFNPSVLVIDGATNATESLAGGGHEVAVDTRTNKIYVANNGSIGVIDGATNAVTYINDPNANDPVSVAVDEVTDRIYVLNRLSQNVTVIDGAGMIPSAPGCQLTNVTLGPPKQLNVMMQDTGSGLKSINLVDSVNASVIIPAFSPGTTSPVLVTATKSDQAQSSDVAFVVTDMAGLTTSCDPVDFTLALDGPTERHVFRSVSPAEHYVRIMNGTPGVRRITFLVNGHSFPIPPLHDGETYFLDIGSAMLATTPDSMAEEEIGARGLAHGPRQGANNVAMFASGQRGSSAYVLIGDASVQAVH
jgi:hypothetical protein